MLIRAANHGRSIEVSAAPSGTLAMRDKLVLSVKSPGSNGVVVLEGARELGHIDGAEGRIEISPATLGEGIVHLQVVGLGGRPQNNVFARPLSVTVTKDDG
jgi:hypothetical protein